MLELHFDQAHFDFVRIGDKVHLVFRPFTLCHPSVPALGLCVRLRLSTNACRIHCCKTIRAQNLEQSKTNDHAENLPNI